MASKIKFYKVNYRDDGDEVVKSPKAHALISAALVYCPVFLDLQFPGLSEAALP